VSLRDQTEHTLRAWDAYERGRGASPVIDFDCYPDGAADSKSVGRIDTLRALEQLEQEGANAGRDDIVTIIRAHIAYLRAVLGERTPLDEYMRATQGCPASGWTSERIECVRASAVQAMEGLGVAWSANTESDLEALEGPVPAEQAKDVILASAADFETRVRALTGATAQFKLSVETVKIDEYWSYWLDGAGERVRLRLNLRNARFTQVTARKFALHEILGHALQYASYSERCRSDDVMWVRLLAVHAQHQVLCEGLAQAMPLFVTPDSADLIARVKLDHLCQLVLADLHINISSGQSIESCVFRAQSIIPFWSADRIADALADRSNSPQLRSYLWAYPAGLDWFATLASQGSTVEVQEVLRAAYRDPLTPAQLQRLWPAGPTIGGS
jgi:hypothetical protein